jgi:hypothetical protein
MEHLRSTNGENSSGHSVDGAAASLDDVLITAELARRPTRAPDYAAENRALSDLAACRGLSKGLPPRGFISGNEALRRTKTHQKPVEMGLSPIINTE